MSAPDPAPVPSARELLDEISRVNRAEPWADVDLLAARVEAVLALHLEMDSTAKRAGAARSTSRSNGREP